MRKLIEKDQGQEKPENLPGGILLDQAYMVSPSEVNSLLFSPDSSFYPSLAKFQGSTELKIGPWRFEVDDGDFLKRKITEELLGFLFNLPWSSVNKISMITRDDVTEHKSRIHQTTSRNSRIPIYVKTTTLKRHRINVRKIS